MEHLMNALRWSHLEITIFLLKFQKFNDKINKNHRKFNKGQNNHLVPLMEKI